MGNIMQGALNAIADEVLNQVRDWIVKLAQAGADPNNAPLIVGDVEAALNAFVLEFTPGALRLEVEGFLHAMEASANPALTENVKVGLAIALARVEAILGVKPTSAQTADRVGAQVNAGALLHGNGGATTH